MQFGLAQQRAYSLWINDICDVYLELIKPVVYDTSPGNADARWASQATLWHSLETGLKILHPMMPFVTEELWQRLPGRGTLGASEPKTIMLAPYPEGDADISNAPVEEGMKAVMAAVGACRSMRTTYNIANKDRPTFYAKCSAARAETLAKQKSDIETLGKGNLKLNEEHPKVSLNESRRMSRVDGQSRVWAP